MPTDDPGQPRRKTTALAWKVAGLFLAFVLVCLIFLPTADMRRPDNSVNECRSNLRQIGHAMLLYANDNGGAYPGEFDALLETQDITPAVFVCPAFDAGTWHNPKGKTDGFPGDGGR